MSSEANAGPLRVGEAFLKYEIVGLLGKGGQGYVYEAFDPFLERRVAIKLVPNPREPERARQEARVLLRLGHPNIVQLIDGGVLETGAFYLIMERLEGASLRAVLSHYKRLTVPETLLIAEQTTRALEAAHRARVIHRDIKPENIFVQAGNRLKILDFGIAKLVDANSLTTGQQATPGTLSYMSPEQIEGGAVTERSDFYALGTILYEALAGVHPCVIGTHDLTPAALLGIQLLRAPPRLDQVAPHVPNDFAELIHRLLEKKAEERPTSAEAVLRALEQCRAHSDERGSTSAARDLWRTDHDGAAPALSDDLTNIEKRSSFLHGDSEAAVSRDSPKPSAGDRVAPPQVGSNARSERTPAANSARVVLASLFVIALCAAALATWFLRSKPAVAPSNAPAVAVAPGTPTASSISVVSSSAVAPAAEPMPATPEAAGSASPHVQSTKSAPRIGKRAPNVTTKAAASAATPAKAEPQPPTVTPSAPPRGPDPIFGERK